MSNIPPNFFTVHASATYPSMDIDIEWIRRIHTEEKNFNDVGYHYFIKRDGTVQKGRPDHVQGAQVLHHNEKNIGICMAGGLKEGTQEPEDNYTDAQYHSLTTLLYKLHKKYPHASIMGHNEFSGHESRGCPCFDIAAYRKWFNRALHSLYKPDDWMSYDWKRSSYFNRWEDTTIYKEVDSE